MSPAATSWSFLPCHFTLVSRLAARDGVALCSEQLLDAIGGDRDIEAIPVAVSGPREPGARHLRGRLRLLKLLRYVRRRRPLVLMWSRAHFIHGRLPERLLTYTALAVVLARRESYLVVHDLEDERAPAPGLLRHVGRSLEGRIRGLAFARADALVVHTAWERARFEQRFPAPGRAAYVVPHGELFEPAADLGRADVRARLELPREAFVFACIGFLTPEKGFDRALDAFERLPHGRGARLCIVGSPYGPTPDAHRSMAELRRRAAQVPGAELREGYLAAAAFDLWLRAADVVLTPSRAGASSSVVARAELFATPLITSATGDLAAAGADVTVVHDDEELYEAMARKLGESSSPSSRNGRV